MSKTSMLKNLPSVASRSKNTRMGRPDRQDIKHKPPTIAELKSLESGNEAQKSQEATANAELAGRAGVGGSRRGRRAAVAGGSGGQGCIASWVWGGCGDRRDRGGPHRAARRGSRHRRDNRRLGAPDRRSRDGGALGNGRDGALAGACPRAGPSTVTPLADVLQRYGQIVPCRAASDD